jgi:hypothetical protein
VGSENSVRLQKPAGRQLTWTLSEPLAPLHFLIRDRDTGGSAVDLARATGNRSLPYLYVDLDMAISIPAAARAE